jgi:DNA repair protein RecO (recombination protein O)
LSRFASIFAAAGEGISRGVPREISTAALVLRTRPYGESDRLVTLLTEEHGKLTGIAKGAKNSRRRFAGTLEPFLQVRATFQHRPNGDLVFLHRCELIRALRRFTQDLDRYVAGSYVLDLADRMVLGRESGADVYGLVRDTLVFLDGHGRSDTLLHVYELHLLAASGWAPELARCPSCGRDLAGLPTVYLVADRGGFLCRSCVPTGELVRPVAGRTARALARLAAGPLADGITAPAVTGEAGTVLEALLAGATSGPVRSRELLHLGCIASPNGTR